ncbi:hypothetical protein SETIT_2G036200v2 [Setaria italica]|uniref:Reverse transcriptase zinc-binding domain-containing protein n=1 Tax=Setaria italica TaxID=4555 RepID=A0A368PUR0_SETIT|nr:hypothetical protein SETIT_2G036200v2 [Setaria italica]
MCALCDQVPETASHICLQCCYAKEIWLLVSNWVGSGANLLTGVDGDIHEWWNRLLAPLNANQRRLVAAILMDTTWNIWKERNRRIFDNTTLRPDQVFELIQNDVLTRRREPELIVRRGATSHQRSIHQLYMRVLTVLSLFWTLEPADVDLSADL